MSSLKIWSMIERRPLLIGKVLLVTNTKVRSIWHHRMKEMTIDRGPLFVV